MIKQLIAQFIMGITDLVSSSLIPNIPGLRAKAWRTNLPKQFRMKLKLCRSHSVALTGGADAENLDGVVAVAAVGVDAAVALTWLSPEHLEASTPRQLLAHEEPELHRG